MNNIDWHLFFAPTFFKTPLNSSYSTLWLTFSLLPSLLAWVQQKWHHCLWGMLPQLLSLQKKPLLLPETFRCPVTEASTARMGQQAPAPGLSPKLTEMGKSLPIDLHMFGFRFLINDLFINVNNKFVPYIPSAYYMYLYQVKQLKHRLSTVTYSLRV